MAVETTPEDVLMESPPETPSNDPGGESMNEDDTSEVDDMKELESTEHVDELTDYEMEETS